jgi:hypothetical protein
LYKVEPSKSVLARNLLAKDDCRPPLADEMEERRPQVPLVSKPRAAACRAERLARAAAGPHGPGVVPPGASQSVGPDADPGEEVALRIPVEVAGSHVADVTLVDDSVGDVSCGDEIAEPLRGIGIDLVVVGGQV